MRVVYSLCRLCRKTVFLLQDESRIAEIAHMRADTAAISKRCQHFPCYEDSTDK